MPQLHRAKVALAFCFGVCRVKGVSGLLVLSRPIFVLLTHLCATAGTQQACSFGSFRHLSASFHGKEAARSLSPKLNIAEFAYLLPSLRRMLDLTQGIPLEVLFWLEAQNT